MAARGRAVAVGGREPRPREPRLGRPERPVGDRAPGRERVLVPTHLLERLGPQEGDPVREVGQLRLEPLRGPERLLGTSRPEQRQRPQVGGARLGMPGELRRGVGVTAGVEGGPPVRGRPLGEERREVGGGQRRGGRGCGQEDGGEGVQHRLGEQCAGGKVGSSGRRVARWVTRGWSGSFRGGPPSAGARKRSRIRPGGHPHPGRPARRDRDAGARRRVAPARQPDAGLHAVRALLRGPVPLLARELLPPMGRVLRGGLVGAARRRLRRARPRRRPGVLPRVPRGRPPPGAPRPERDARRIAHRASRSRSPPSCT